MKIKTFIILFLVFNSSFSQHKKDLTFEFEKCIKEKTDKLLPYSINISTYSRNLEKIFVDEGYLKDNSKSSYIEMLNDLHMSYKSDTIDHKYKELYKLIEDEIDDVYLVRNPSIFRIPNICLLKSIKDRDSESLRVYKKFLNKFLKKGEIDNRYLNYDLIDKFPEEFFENSILYRSQILFIFYSYIEYFGSKE